MLAALYRLAAQASLTVHSSTWCRACWGAVTSGSMLFSGRLLPGRATWTTRP